ncbi:type II toxin-antitoxin system RelE/ParE family toxin [Prosthecobacter sp. SYSU 5D2]|uniref:type II toxin-antitoxin system RelE/ParE family toxin n=1 Tax=Prosthecobacter sp. SYSU 5D2 TaxID=3134134 RepID=UPI0031FE845F
MTVSFESEALEEYREAAQYSEDRFGLGRQFVQAIENALAEISNHPERFQPVGEGIRIFRMRRFPYYLFYHYDTARESIVIYAVAHHRRQTDYWRGRL